MSAKKEDKPREVAAALLAQLAAALARQAAAEDDAAEREKVKSHATRRLRPVQ